MLVRIVKKKQIDKMLKSVADAKAKEVTASAKPVEPAQAAEAVQTEPPTTQESENSPEENNVQ